MLPMFNIHLPKLATLDLIAVVIILLAICFWLFSKQSDAKLKKTIQKESDNALYNTHFQCVVFTPSSDACQFALAYSTKPILLSNLPKVPLSGCKAKNCTCQLVHFDDRRTGQDRRDLEALAKNSQSIHKNKRLLKDRRRDSIQQFLLPKYRSFS